MSQSYELPKVWKWEPKGEGKFANINRPTSGATHESQLPSGKHSLQLYSLATPNGVKVTILLEELLERGIVEAEYDAYTVNILEGDQFGSDFVQINPNSKIPALIDRSTDPEVRLFESGSILLYLADKFKFFIPGDFSKRAEVMNWLFWQMGSAPYVGGGFGHFYSYAPEKIPYCIDRFTMETKRQLDVLNKQLEAHSYIAGDEYTIADIAIWPWYGELLRGHVYQGADVFLDAQSYPYLLEWANKIGERSAVKRGRVVNRTWGDDSEQLPERHSSEDFKNLNL